jgi:hypothetical protein
VCPHPPSASASIAAPDQTKSFLIARFLLQS